MPHLAALRMTAQQRRARAPHQDLTTRSLSGKVLPPCPFRRAGTSLHSKSQIDMHPRCHDGTTGALPRKEILAARRLPATRQAPRSV